MAVDKHERVALRIMGAAQVGAQGLAGLYKHRAGQMEVTWAPIIEALGTLRVTKPVDLQADAAGAGVLT